MPIEHNTLESREGSAAAPRAVRSGSQRASKASGAGGVCDEVAGRAVFVSAPQLAAHLGVSLGQVHRLSASGKIPRVKLGHRTVRFDLAKVLAALAAPNEQDAMHPVARSPRRTSPDRPVCDLPAYNWSSPMAADGTLPSADRRG